MLLLTMHEWFGPGRRMTAEQRDSAVTTEGAHGFVTRLPLGEAIERIATYESAFNQHYFMALNYRLLAVSIIPDLTESQIEMADLIVVEDLKQDVNFFD